jgi:hypothetical protein
VIGIDQITALRQLLRVTGIEINLSTAQQVLNS